MALNLSYIFVDGILVHFSLHFITLSICPIWLGMTAISREATFFLVSVKLYVVWSYFEKAIDRFSRTGRYRSVSLHRTHSIFIYFDALRTVSL